MLCLVIFGILEVFYSVGYAYIEITLIFYNLHLGLMRCAPRLVARFQ